MDQGERERAEDQDAGSAAGSESGGSAVESLAGEQTLSSQASAYEVETPVGVSREPSSRDLEGASNVTFSVPEEDNEMENSQLKMHSLRLLILDQLLSYVPRLREVGGVRCIPYMQVILMLTADLDASDDKDRALLGKLLDTFMSEIEINQKESEPTSQRSSRREMQLIILRLFSVLMSRSKTWQNGGGRSSSSVPPSSNSQQGGTYSEVGSNLVSKKTSTALVNSGCMEHCLKILTDLLGFWKTVGREENAAKVGSSLLKAQPLLSPPDMSPFFLKQYVKGHAHDVFEAYPQLLTEMTLRLPYQVKKISESPSSPPPSLGPPLLPPLPAGGESLFGPEWHRTLCEYMMTHQTPYVRRQVRKLLLYVCGSKEKYRELRDLHTLSSHMKDVRKVVEEDLGKSSNAAVAAASSSSTKSVMSFPYDTLLSLIEHLKSCLDVATSRTQNWQKFCIQDETVLAFLFQLSFILDDGVSPIVLQLLQAALCVASTPGASVQASGSSLSRGRSGIKASSPSQSRPDDQGSKEDSAADHEMLNAVLVRKIHDGVNRDMLSRFVEKFLLECNSTAVRWQAHSLVVTLHK